MITRIRLKNWKSHLDSEFRFSKGVNAFIGRMGSGKTSVMDAISFALYGTFPAHQGRRVSLDELIMRKPQGKKSSTVELSFSMEGKDYSIKRVLELEKGTTISEIREDGNLLEVNPQGVTGVVERILQMDYDLFSRAVYSEQNALDYFLTIPPGHRKLLIDRMLRLERFEKAREAAIAMANRTEQQNEERARMVSDLEREGLGEKRGKLEREIGDMGAEARELEKKHKEAESGRKALEGRLSALEEKEDLLNNAAAQLEGMKSGLAEIRETIRELRERLKGKSQEKLGEEMEEAEKLIRNLESEQGRMAGEADSRRERIGALNKEVSIIRDEVKRLMGLGAECPLCGSRVTEERRINLLEDRRRREAEALQEAGLHAEELRGINIERDALDRKIREAEMGMERLSGLAGEIKRLGELEERKSRYSEGMERLEETIKGLEGESDRAGLKKLRKELEGRGAEEASLAERLSGLAERIGEKEERLAEVREREDRIMGYKKEIKEAENMAGGLRKFTKALLLTQDQLRSEFLKTVNNIMEGLWGELYPYGDFEGIRLAVDGDYTLQLKEPGGWVSAEGSVSGGERSMACLALRIAFSLAFIPNLRWLILDEPTHNLDSQAIEHFARILREKMPGIVEQVFLITHEERISEGVTGSLYKLERDKEQNGPTIVAEG